MREELKTVLNKHLARLVQELDISVTFLTKLVSERVIHPDQKKIIQVSTVDDSSFIIQSNVNIGH